MSSIATAPRAAAAVPATRLASVDLIRGAVMVLMAIDHVRVYAGVPAGGPEPAIFFTRWITHFCAPAFVFLAGTSAFLHAGRHADVGRYLLTRGAWLVLLELTILRIAWTFNLEFMRYNMAGVIWVIGWCMILLALLVRLPVLIVGAFGVVVIAAHNLLDPLLGTLIPALGESRLSALWKILYLGFFAGPISIGGDGPQLWILYSIVPWIGVIAAGYAFGAVVTLEPQRRRRLCASIGLGAIGLFLLLRGFNLYGDPQPWGAAAEGGDGVPMPALLAFLNTNKYPASLAFLLMTLGPTIALMPWLDSARGALARWLTVFGRVPFFFYVLHIPLIHALALLVSRIRMGEVSPWLLADHPMAPPPAPDGYMWSLPLLYAVWAVAVVMLFFASRWFAALKTRRTDWWLKYL
jgi:uncharacterized membrane protein